ncbi:Dos2-interacting transcription regulator of RNA-Pol-II-domain-containing protein [Protomyces lactucae-debilis]|uniref:MMS19 nucleotide excision repair protein n=1 Tax=Protomyces lactucae-debilis TaxID=2754530 RepID=A0A1Y2FEP7_PROLT|nr:Dos2-interacting transcription regulator of RNA-Pol-II-domain-containing protein [Protomyces lactucae-debilis]ORY81884.1 Dos2-interacting transcription regulator of RNA-Pol-II-domain-containing protein [Protomyces lactucae-debilis]
MAMNIQSLVSTYLRSSAGDSDRQEVVLELAQAIANGKLPFLEVVTALGEHLTQTDATIRAGSMQLLSQLLVEIPGSTLSGQHITVMIQFFNDKLDDHVCLDASLDSLLALAKMSRFSGEDAQTLCSALFSAIEASPNLPQRTRHRFFLIVDHLVATRRKDMRAMGQPFLAGIITLMSGEKDPRNLMLAFSIMRVLLQEFDIVNHVSDLFDVVYCYFPITFRPPPDDPTSITTDDLKQRLRDCLCATHQFAPYLIPELLEKLNAIAVSVKRDTLMTISACCRNYTARTLDAYTAQLWAALKFEITSAEDPELEKLALATLTDLTECLGRGLSEMPKQGPLARWLQPIMTDAIDQLRQAELKSGKPCGKILQAVGVASPLALDVTTKSTLAGWLALYQETNDINRKEKLLDVLRCLIGAAQQVEGSLRKPLGGKESCLASLKDDLFGVLTGSLLGSSVSAVELRIAALKTLVEFTQVDGLCSEQERSTTIQYLGDVLLDGQGELAEQALIALADFAVVRAPLILELTFPAVFARFPLDVEQDESKPILKRLLYALYELAVDRAIFDTLVIRLYSRLDEWLSKDPSNLVELTQLVVSTLHACLKRFVQQEKDVAVHFDRVVPHLLQRTVVPRDTSHAMANPRVLLVTSSIVNLIIRACTIEKQRDIAANLFAIFMNGGLNEYVPHIDTTFKPLDPETTDVHVRNSVALFVAGYAGLRREIELINAFNLDFLVRVINLTATCSNDFQRLALYRLTCLILNKTSAEEDVGAAVQHFLAQKGFTGPANVDILLWVTKALILKSHKQAQACVVQIIDLIGQGSQGQQVAEKFSVLIGNDAYVSKENHLQVKKLHKQKFFALAMPRLTEKLAQSEQGSRHLYLMCMSAILANVPREVFMGEIATILPILLQCISLEQSGMKLAAIETVDQLLPQAKDIVAQHLSTLIPGLLEVTRASPTNTPVSPSDSLPS